MQTQLTHNTIALAKSYFTAIQNNDTAILAALVDPNVVWHQPGANIFSGTHQGAEHVFAMIVNMMELSLGSFKIDCINAVMANGQQVAVSLHFSAKREGASMAMAGVDILTFSNGKIIEASLFSADQAAEDAFWGLKSN